jgi:hypothetical protein
MKDWTGNGNSVYKQLGVTSNPNNKRHKEDYYATDPKAAKLLMQLEDFSENIWEPACGEGHLSKVFEQAGHKVKSSDLFDRGFGDVGVDFLGIENVNWDGDIITNPPYKYAQEFVEKALKIIPDGRKVAMFLKVQFLEGKARKALFTNHPPKTVYVSSSRILCAKNAEFQKMISGGGSVVAYAWFVWVKGYKGVTELKWFN